MSPLYRFEGQDRVWHWNLNPHTDNQPSDLRVDVYDLKCIGCGALYEPPAPDVCQLCGHICFEPVEGLAF